MSTEKNTEEQILEAAREVFIHKGFAGTRMQEIANKAGINKALLHYYFRSKDQLFEAVFSQAISSFMPVIRNILEADIPLVHKIILFVETYQDILIKNPHIPGFVIQELNTDPGRLIMHFKTMGIDPQFMLEQIRQEVKQGSIRPINGEHFLVNLLGMCLFPFVARPVVQGVLKKSEEEYRAFLQERKSEIIQFVLQSISHT